MVPFGNEIWLADGPEVTAAAGFAYPTRMVAVRLADGGVWLWSPVAAAPEVLDAVAALGPVAHLVAPNGLHDSWIGEWARSCPEAQVHLAPGLGAKRPDLGTAAELGETAPAAWAGQIDQVLIRTALTDEVVFYHRASGTVLVTDLLQNIDPATYAGWRKLVARMDLMTSGAPEMPHKFRLALRDRKAARQAVDRMLGWAPERMILAHGAPGESGATEVLERAFGWLKPAG